ncbi:accessory factor UbiK family protein [Pseudoroseomonas ludipueritiae]|uniref:Accessory factor UbiK family protein n=1 Tax=Pseudoroseomonas ludipueritiae TaxID=198093 RepID=A0ABR7REH3_9PROT|nr:accessory factor UbiK family protein [Pseudoroseomonas ludipueritiae]MBC9180059.1 accessory factor UbiK family protein [Pseudoroseomonas ludipueritiae]MCG7360682.1 accessory factor UbiK family protein [Roseomonas sp. ACRSG]
MTDTKSESGTGTGYGPGRRGRFFDDLAGVAGGAFSVFAGARAELESLVKSQVEMLAQRLELVRREDLDAALEVARRAREESTALAARVAALEAKLGTGAAAKPAAAEEAPSSPTPKEDPKDPASLA